MTDKFMKAVICCLKLEKNELFCVLAKRIETLSAVKSKPFSYKIDVNRNARLHWKSLM